MQVQGTYCLNSFLSDYTNYVFLRKLGGFGQQSTKNQTQSQRKHQTNKYYAMINRVCPDRATVMIWLLITYHVAQVDITVSLETRLYVVECEGALVPL